MFFLEKDAFRQYRSEPIYIIIYIYILYKYRWIWNLRCVTSCVAVNKKSWPGSLHLPRNFLRKGWQDSRSLWRSQGSSTAVISWNQERDWTEVGYSKLFYWDEVLVFAWWCSAVYQHFGHHTTGNGKSAKFLRQVFPLKISPFTADFLLLFLITQGYLSWLVVSNSFNFSIYWE